MKMILLHGGLQTAVLNKLAQLKKDFDSLSISELKDSPNLDFSSTSLFSDKRLIILENPDLRTVEKASFETDPALTIILKYNKSLEKSSPILKKLTEIKAEIISFDETNQNTVFPFLDTLGSRNKNSLKEFEKNYTEFGGQYLLTMFGYFLRRMIQKPKSSSSFMLQKLESQKKNFPLEKIKKLYKEIIETDYKIKQGLIDEKLGITLLINKIINN